MDTKKLELLKQSLNAAESSLKLAKQLLSEVEGGKTAVSKPNNPQNFDDVSGIAGVFDGENMVTATGETFPVPSNYASKSMLVVGDTLKLVEEGKNKEKRFKQIEHVKRHKSMGILTKKEGKWRVVTPEGSYKVLGAAVEHFGADIGTEVTLHLPANNLTVGYGAIEAVKNSEKKEETESVEPSEKEIKVEKVEMTKEAPSLKTEIEKKVSSVPTKPKIDTKKAEPKKHSPVTSEQKLEKKPETLRPVVKPEVVAPKPESKPAPVQTPVSEPIASKPVEVPTVAAPVSVPMKVSSEEEELT